MKARIERGTSKPERDGDDVQGFATKCWRGLCVTVSTKPPVTMGGPRVQMMLDYSRQTFGR
jgi:hypothetical protein